MPHDVVIPVPGDDLVLGQSDLGRLSSGFLQYARVCQESALCVKNSSALLDKLVEDDAFKYDGLFLGGD